jgi:hypothetical protein
MITTRIKRHWRIYMVHISVDICFTNLLKRAIYQLLNSASFADAARNGLTVVPGLWPIEPARARYVPEGLNVVKNGKQGEEKFSKKKCLLETCG